jgi:hypothetical protein
MSRDRAPGARKAVEPCESVAYVHLAQSAPERGVRRCWQPEAQGAPGLRGGSEEDVQPDSIATLQDA